MIQFTKEEISLCKQVAERNRKDLKIGMYVWQEFSKTVQMICGLDEEEKNIYLVVPKTGNKKVVYWNNLEGGWLTPLWTISDCLEFLRERKWKIEYWHENFSRDWMEIGIVCCFPDPDLQDKKIYRKGKTPREILLKFVLAVSAIHGSRRGSDKH